ncbi:ABC transporter ATP-binding protein [Pelagicoccus albus]|uniref:ATP-binding cassette domain-containing protein n=1 Tax=Pelagicoccus albus TaxID=415222 RepID=A0A7X1E7R9_9BACT|nr:oligopeptide/dipeptide ABC transporter ATP-binding protein [Pelagicoccus albus]MBC2606050.1 ATP-binding cassette domain-containing protein [Pelagicoccus albus]
MSETLLDVKDLKVHFPLKSGLFSKTVRHCKAVDGVSLNLKQGETFGLVGESGCGKSTLGKTICRLIQPTAGDIVFEGQNVAKYNRNEMRPLRRDIQMVFQDPAESLNSRHTVREILEEPFVIHGIGDANTRLKKVHALLDRVGLGKAAAEKYSFEFSGGQRQRIGIARAIALEPKLIICDEPVSALDVSVQSQILNLLIDLQKEMGLTYLFIAHDLAVVKVVSDRIGVMYLGKMVEVAEGKELFANPMHEYTKALISAIPEPNPRREKNRVVLRGDVPSPIDPPPGCAFARRSPIEVSEEVASQPGEFKEVTPGHWVEVHPATVADYDNLK